MPSKKKPGRPRQLRSPEMVTMRLPASLIKRLDAFARRRSAASRSEAARYLLTYALEEMGKQDRARPARSKRAR